MKRQFGMLMGMVSIVVLLFGCGNKAANKIEQVSEQKETQVEKESELREESEGTTDKSKGVSKNETTETEKPKIDTKQLTKDQVKEWVRAVVDVNVKPDSEMANYTLRFEDWGNGDGLTYVAVGPPEGMQIDNTLGIYRLNGEGKLQQAQGLGPMAEWKVVSEEFMDVSKVEVIVAPAEKEKVDTKSLTKDQAIDWVKHYLVQNGGTLEELDEKVVFKADMIDGYLQISEYHPNMSGEGNSLAYIYRVNSNGELEEGSINNRDDWHVISTEYID